MKVLFVQKVKGYAGSENWMTSIIPALEKKGVDCHLLCVIPPNDLSKLDKFQNVLNDNKIKHTLILSDKNLSFSLLIKLKSIAIKDDYDLIHLNLIHAELWFSILKAFFGLKTKLVSTIHGFDEKFQSKNGFDPSKIKNTKYIRILKFCQKRISNYYAVSQGLLNLVTESNIIPKDKIRVINYGFDYPNVQPTLKKTKDKIIFVPGRIVPYKGQELVVDSIKYLVERNINFKIIFAGELQGGYGNYLKEKIAKLNYSHLTSFVGHVPNIHEYYLNSDVVVLPSKSEGFGLVLLEAFNYEVPVTTFDVPAFNETIDNNITGLITSCFDVKELSNNIIKLLLDVDFAKAITVNAKKRLLEYYCLDRMVDDTINFYKDSLLD